MNETEFDQFADEYEASLSEVVRLSGEAPDYFAAQKVAEAARIMRSAQRKPKMILDFGAGVGSSLPHFENHFPMAKIICAEISARSLAVARKRFANRATFTQIEDNSLPVAESTADLLFAACVFHHIPHDEHLAWIQQLYRVARPGANAGKHFAQRWLAGCPVQLHAVFPGVTGKAATTGTCITLATARCAVLRHGRSAVTLSLSTVTPVYRGEATLQDLVQELEHLRAGLESSDAPIRLVEAIFVDDGSEDGSRDQLESLASTHDWVRIVTLAKNFGQHPATMAGVLHSSGDWVATLDEDLQHRPQYLLNMLHHAASNSLDVIYAQPLEAVHQSTYRDSSSRLFKWLISKVSGDTSVRSFSSFRLMRGSIARAASAVAGHQTYFDMAVSWFTDRIAPLPLPMADLRYQNTNFSGYRLHSLLSHGRRMLLSTDIKVLRLGAATGAAAMLLSLLVTLYVLVARVFFPASITVSGWASVMVAVLFLGGLIALLVGMLLESTSVMLMQSHGKPTFFEVNRQSDKALADGLPEPVETL